MARPSTARGSPACSHSIERSLPLLAAVWDELSEQAQLEMTAAKSGLLSEGVVGFWKDPEAFRGMVG